MSDFDAVLVGGGHHSLITACYLAKAGLRVLVLERRHELGGGLSTEEIIIPGFRHNLHSAFHSGSKTGWPWFEDLDLEDYGVEYVRPDVSAAMPLSDGRCLVTYKDPQRTADEIARFSSSDSQAYLKMYEFFQKLVVKGGLMYEDFCPPIPTHEREGLLNRSKMGREYWRIMNTAPRQYFDELFEDSHLKAMLLFNLAITATNDDVPDHRGWVVKATLGTTRMGLCRGGSHRLAHGLVRCLLANGGMTLESSHVEKILIRDGVALGVRLKDGKEITSRIIVSGVDPKQTMLRLVGEEHLDGDLARRIRAIKEGFRSIIFGVHLALNEAPKYKCASFNPDVNAALNYNIGYETPERLQEHWREIEAGVPPRNPAAQCGVFTLFDKTLAPPGKHTAFFWQFAPYSLREGGAERWDTVKEEYMELCLDKWRGYAPNLTNENILGRYAYTPLNITRKIVNMLEGDFNVIAVHPDQNYDRRPVPELAQGRTPIKNLYVTGAGLNPGGSIHGSAGYFVAGVIADDLGIKKWWTPPNLKQIYSRLADV